MLRSEGPVPLLAELNASSGEWSCTFDQALRPGALNFKNWRLRTATEIFTTSSAVAAGHVVSGKSTSTGEIVGKASMDWVPPPADVVNAIDQPAFEFAGLPLVVT